jgi:hypothetical protein
MLLDTGLSGCPGDLPWDHPASASRTGAGSRAAPTPPPGQVNFSFVTLISGLTLLTIARVMRLGATMREELDVTI